MGTQIVYQLTHDLSGHEQRIPLWGYAIIRDATPNSCLAPLDQGPFYAVRLYVGEIGTFAGLKTDEHARVLNDADQPIAGLYAAGNDQASVFGGAYPGPGSTLGPGMTFGYIAALHAAGRTDLLGSLAPVEVAA